jgi:hypothetical protein
VALREAPQLRTLHLDLSYNQIGDEGAAALVALRESRMLHTLHLDVRNNGVTATGMQALAHLKMRSVVQNIQLQYMGDAWRATPPDQAQPRRHGGWVVFEGFLVASSVQLIPGASSWSRYTQHM